MNTPPHGRVTLTRRTLVVSAVSSAIFFTKNSAAGVTNMRGSSIRRIRVGTPTAVPDSLGDTWAAAWGDDDHLYTPNDDGPGFRSPGSRPGVDIMTVLTKEQKTLFEQDPKSAERTVTADQLRKLAELEGADKETVHFALNRLIGNDPLKLRGENVNRFPDFEKLDHVKRDPFPFWWAGADGCTWKTTNCIFLNGVLYLAIARHNYGNVWGKACTRQTARNASIIKSGDYGMSWKRSAKENLDSPMFPGPYFATPYFIDYGRSAPEEHGAGRYIYAISNNGYWDNGDTLVLGRILKERIGALKGSDWEFFTGGAHGDGMRNTNWAADAGLATPILGAPGKFGMSAASYLPSRQRYLLISWHFPACSGHVQDGGKMSVWDFYESEMPWGPWTNIGSHTWNPVGYYSPVICPKFQSESRIYAFAGNEINASLTVVPLNIV